MAELKAALQGKADVNKSNNFTDRQYINVGTKNESDMNNAMGLTLVAQPDAVSSRPGIAFTNNNVNTGSLFYDLDNKFKAHIGNANYKLLDSRDCFKTGAPETNIPYIIAPAGNSGTNIPSIVYAKKIGFGLTLLNIVINKATATANTRVAMCNIKLATGGIPTILSFVSASDSIVNISYNTANGNLEIFVRHNLDNDTMHFMIYAIEN